MTKALLIVTAIIEAATGLVLILAPSAPVFILFGYPLDTAVGLAMGRVAGAALLALGLACWLARNDEGSRATTGLIAAMLLYNAAAAAVLVHSRVAVGLSGIGLWPGVAVHAALGVLCVASLRIARSNPGTEAIR